MKDWFKTYSLTIAAGGVNRIDSYARFIAVLSSTSSTDMKAILGDGRAIAELPAGVSLELPQGEFFKSITIQNPTGGNVTLKIALSMGSIYDRRFTVASVLSVTTAATVTSTPPAVAVAASPAAATLLLAAYADRHEIIVSNDGANKMYVGDPNVDAAANRGVPIAPGGSVVLNTTAAIYGMAVAAGATTASIVELRRV